MTPWTEDCQAPLAMGFPRKEYWSGLPFPTPGDLPDPGIELCLLHWQAVSVPLRHLGETLKIAYRMLLSFCLESLISKIKKLQSM